MTAATTRSKVIKQAFSPFGEAIAKSLADELEVKGGLLLPKNTYIEQKKEELIQKIDAEILKRENRMDRAGKLLKEKLESLSSLEKEKIEKELGHSLEIIVSMLKPSPKEKENASLKEEDTFQSILGLSDDTLLWIYTLGYQLSLEHKYEEALSIFQMLTTLNPLVSDYFIAQGLSERSLQYNTEALYSFAMASIMNPLSPVARYNSSEIYLELHQLDDAQLELDALEELVITGKLTDLQPAVESIRSRIQLKKA